MVIKFLILAALVFNLSGCLFKENIEGLLTLKQLGKNQKYIERSIKAQERLFRKLTADIKKDKLKLGIPVESFLRSYGEPVVSKDIPSLGKRFLYRHPTNYFDSDKVYIYFDRQDQLVN
ncbi:MAG: hypothetical protein KKH25_03785, partial [Candidatus Omnitrophica bacterium]|nr:hypothetical protein [Candidatus Omnitrophota bacterium]